MIKDKAETILDKLEESKIKDAHFSQFARDLISNLKEKQQKVVLKRFGLSGRKKVTLDSIGQEYGVTRERIRQIEAKALRRLRHPSRSNKIAAFLGKKERDFIVTCKIYKEQNRNEIY